jgi:hypothetical protein
MPAPAVEGGNHIDVGVFGIEGDAGVAEGVAGRGLFGGDIGPLAGFDFELPDRAVGDSVGAGSVGIGDDQGAVGRDLGVVGNEDFGLARDGDPGFALIVGLV